MGIFKYQWRGCFWSVVPAERLSKPYIIIYVTHITPMLYYIRVYNKYPLRYDTHIYTLFRFPKITLNTFLFIPLCADDVVKIHNVYTVLVHKKQQQYGIYLFSVFPSLPSPVGMTGTPRERYTKSQVPNIRYLRCIVKTHGIPSLMNLAYFCCA